MNTYILPCMNKQTLSTDMLTRSTIKSQFTEAQTIENIHLQKLSATS